MSGWQPYFFNIPAPGSNWAIMYTKTLKHPGEGLNFLIAIRSYDKGYGVEISAVFAVTAIRTGILLSDFVSSNIHPERFYLERISYRKAFLREIVSKLDNGKFVQAKFESDQWVRQSVPSFCANLAGYPNGYPELVGDNLEGLSLSNAQVVRK